MKTNPTENEFYKLEKRIITSKVLTIYEKLVLTYIMSFPKCWASNSTIAESLNISRSSVKRANCSLAKKGLIQITITKNVHQVDGHILTVMQGALSLVLEQSAKLDQEAETIIQPEQQEEADVNISTFIKFTSDAPVDTIASREAKRLQAIRDKNKTLQHENI